MLCQRTRERRRTAVAAHKAALHAYASPRSTHPRRALRILCRTFSTYAARGEMAAAIPFVTVEQAIASLSKIDVLHELLGAITGMPSVKPGEDYFLMPFAIHAVSEGDHELWDGAASFTQSQTLRHQTCLLYTSPSPRDRQKSRMPSSA